MNKSISLTVDTDDYNALTRASDMLRGMAEDIKTDKPGIDKKEKIDSKFNSEEQKIDIKRPDYNKSLEGAENMGDGDIVETTESAGPAAPATTTIPVAVELDSAGLPWDARIHGAKKLKLAKDQTWKKIRGIDLTLVAIVEAELRQVMAIPAAITETDAAPAIVETTESAGPAGPASPAATTETVATKDITWPDLMAKVTTAIGEGVHTTESITAICNKHGLASLPLVSARPDLIPAINAELFPNG